MNVERLEALYQGKAKVVFRTNDPEKYIIYFKDDATAFDGLKKATLKGKGSVNNAISTWIFEYLEKNGIRTHFIKRISEIEMLVHKVEIIPIEMVLRNRATGSITKRLGIKKGLEFHPPLVEYFYKSDELHDPLISENHISQFRWATPKELSHMVEVTQQTNQLLQKVFDQAGLELIDYKLEFGRSSNGSILLADEFTPDGCRLWDRKTGEPMDKDRFRQDLGGTEQAYVEVQERLRKFFESEVK